MDSSFGILFDPSEDAAIHWAARTGLEHALDLRTAEQLYARALPYLKNWAWALATKHGWKQEAVDTVGDMPLAICLGRDELLQSSDGDFSYVARLVLPLNFSDLLNPEFTNDWAAMFSRLTTSSSSSDPADIFQLVRAGIPRPLQNILYLLQILSPGLLVIKSVVTDDEEEGEWDTQDIDLIALPPSIWVGLHIEDLEDIFGAQTALKLYQAAEDPYCASEDAASASSYTHYDTFSDSSYSAFNTDNFDDDEWPELEEPANFDDQDQEGVLPQFSQTIYNKEDAFDYYDTPLLPDVVQPPEPAAAADDYSAQEYHLISVPSDGKASTLMEYRHCDEEGCMTCSQRFAESLTERLLMYSALLAH